MPDLALEHALRAALFAWLDRLRAQLGGPVTHASLQNFTFDGHPVDLLNAAGRGIHRPKLLGADGAALTLLTAAPKPGSPPPYDDSEADDEGYWLYKFQRAGPDTTDNRYVRRAFEHQLSMVYFRGIAKGVYEAFYPVVVTHEDRVNETFHLAMESTPALGRNVPTPADVAAARRYATRAARVRLHQSLFREQVLTAYVNRCTVCRIRHRVLLDAAHIIPDSDTHGVPEVTNGLSLCKIHHAAYDARLLGITPEYVVEINRDLLDEVDGPMLQHGLKERHGERIHLPRKETSWPDRDRLAERFAGFQRG